MRKMTASEKLKKYSEEIKEDLKLNEINIQSRSFEIPQRKHYWVNVLICEMQILKKLEKEQKQLEKEALKAIPVNGLSTKSTKNAILETAKMKEFIQEIDDQKLLVTYLEKVEKIFSYITNDVKNIVEIMTVQSM